MVTSLWGIFILFSVFLPKASNSSQILAETMFGNKEGRRCDGQDEWAVRDEQNVKSEQGVPDGMGAILAILCKQKD